MCNLEKKQTSFQLFNWYPNWLLRLGDRDRWVMEERHTGQTAEQAAPCEYYQKSAWVVVQQPGKKSRTFFLPLQTLVYISQAVEIPHVSHAATARTEREKCHCQRPGNCIRQMDKMTYYKVDEEVLRQHHVGWDNIFAIDEEQKPGVAQRLNRLTAYSLFCVTIGGWGMLRLSQGCFGGCWTS